MPWLYRPTLLLTHGSSTPVESLQNSQPFTHNPPFSGRMFPCSVCCEISGSLSHYSHFYYSDVSVLLATSNDLSHPPSARRHPTQTMDLTSNPPPKTAPSLVQRTPGGSVFLFVQDATRSLAKIWLDGSLLAHLTAGVATRRRKPLAPFGSDLGASRSYELVHAVRVPSVHKMDLGFWLIHLGPPSMPLLVSHRLSLAPTHSFCAATSKATQS
jgi:hypothetical protein